MVGTVIWAMGLEPSPDIGWEITYVNGQQREGHQTLQNQLTNRLSPFLELSPLTVPLLPLDTLRFYYFLL